MTNNTPILAPLPDAEWPAAASHLLHDFAGRLNVYRVMAHNPELLVAWETLRNHVVLHSVLTPRQRELVILRIGHRWESAYEWAHHVDRGLAAGLRMTEIEQVCIADQERTLAGVDAELVRAVDQLLDVGAIAPATLAALLGDLGKEAVLDVMATVGMYSTLAFILKTFATPLEDGFAERLQARIDAARRQVPA